MLAAPPNVRQTRQEQAAIREVEVTAHARLLAGYLRLMTSAAGSYTATQRVMAAHLGLRPDQVSRAAVRLQAEGRIVYGHDHTPLERPTAYTYRMVTA